MIDPLVTAARRWPDAPALTDAAGTRTWSQLLKDAQHLAAALPGTTGDHVALLARDRAASVVAIHGVRLAGRVLVPLHRRLAVPELAARLTASRAGVVLHDTDHEPVIAMLQDVLPDLRSVDLERPGTGRRPSDTAPVPYEPSAIGALILTSGTTAAARVVRLSHGASLASAAAWDRFLDSDPDDHWLATLPLSHVAGLGMVLRPLLSGARLTVHDRFEPDAVRAALADDGVSIMSLVPTQLTRLLDSGPIHAPRLRAMLLGGGPVAPALVRRALEAGLPIVTTYGLTEAASGVTALPAAEARAAPGSAGRPLPGVLLRVVDAEGRDVRAGATGSIIVGGPTLASGYLDDPAATTAAFRDGWLHTRDLGTIDAEGRLWVLDRQDDLIISGGENVSPVQVETVIRSHPAIADVAVVARRHPEWGSVPVAAIVSRPGHAVPTTEEVRRFARQGLAGYELPADVRAVPAIPRTASGKIIRREVLALLDVAASRAAGDASDRFVDRPDGARIHVATQGAGPTVVVLHATLSNAGELRGLATELGAAFRVLVIDRRGAGASTMPLDDEPGPVDVAIHLDDLDAVLDAFAPGERVLAVGHSFGGCVALDLAARRPGRVTGTWVYEPPYLPLLPGGGTLDLQVLGDRITRLARDEGVESAALAFLDAVRGPGTAARLPASARERLAAEGRSAVADAALLGFEPAGLAAIDTPVAIALGGRSAAMYAGIADGLAGILPSLEVERFPDLGHTGPVSQPAPIARAIEAFARRIGSLGPPDGAEATP
jgi:O-succinylbenzoic acid--CoA ligase